MGIDYTASVVYGVPVEAPEGEEDVYEWAVGLAAGTPYRVFSTGSSYNETYYALGLGASGSSRGGMGWKEWSQPNGQSMQTLRSWLRSVGIEEKPRWLLGLHQW